MSSVGHRAEEPDVLIRQRRLLLDGPNPGRILEQRLVLPLDRRSIDLHTGTIRRGGLIESGPDPSIRLQICLQLGPVDKPQQSVRKPGFH